MRLVTSSLLGAACAAALLASPAANSANLPLCVAIAQNYNNCVRQSQFAGFYRRGYGPGYPGRPYGGDGDYDDYQDQAYGPGYGGYGPGYGGYGPGYGGYGPGYGGYRRQRYERAKAACAVWFVQMRASGCFN
ncbi:MAG: hypothetical protein U1E20_08160 [Methylocystis sp.]|uniref:hypothetical protein n=1 Tax=Methylocystis sp. TaxID=1911079 RepID=UPI0039630579